MCAHSAGVKAGVTAEGILVNLVFSCAFALWSSINYWQDWPNPKSLQAGALIYPVACCEQGKKWKWSLSICEYHILEARSMAWCGVGYRSGAGSAWAGLVSPQPSSASLAEKNFDVHCRAIHGSHCCCAWGVGKFREPSAEMGLNIDYWQL